jgi:hypothetical protein
MTQTVPDLMKIFMLGQHHRTGSGSPVNLIDSHVAQKISKYLQVEKLLFDFNQQLSGQSIKNPHTNRQIKVGSPTYKKLVKSCDIETLINFDHILKPDDFNDICYQCGYPHCLTKNSGYCCCCADRRPLLRVGKIIHAFRSEYVDKYGERIKLDYAWKDYCKNCVSRCHHEQQVRDIRTTSVQNGGWFETQSIEVIHGATPDDFEVVHI